MKINRLFIILFVFTLFTCLINLVKNTSEVVDDCYVALLNKNKVSLQYIRVLIGCNKNVEEQKEFILIDQLKNNLFQTKLDTKENWECDVKIYFKGNLIKKDILNKDKSFFDLKQTENESVDKVSLQCRGSSNYKNYCKSRIKKHTTEKKSNTTTDTTSTSSKLKRLRNIQ